jgi:hypothetical protein
MSPHLTSPRRALAAALALTAAFACAPGRASPAQGENAVVQSAFDAYMAGIPDGPAKEAGEAVGSAAAAGLLAMRAGDHFDDDVPFVQPGPGVFEPVAATPPVDTKLGAVRPFSYASPEQYPPPRPAVADEPALCPGPASWRPTAAWAAPARLFWRPVHAIQRADADGNPATTADPGWAPLLVVNHPEYPSGHACFTAAVTEALGDYFGTKRVPLTISSTAPGAGAPRTYASLDDVVADLENARVWSGLHVGTTMTRTAR